MARRRALGRAVKTKKQGVRYEVHCFYVESLESEYLMLGEQESTHCVRVLRLQAGEAVLLTDGRGTQATGNLAEVGKRGVGVAISQRQRVPRRRGQQSVMVVAPTKNADRMEWFVEKATEVGCGAIIPLQCSRGVRGRLNADRLYRVAVAALKQSQGAYLPKIYPVQGFSEFFRCLASVEATLNENAQGDSPYLRVVAHCAEGNRRDLHELILTHAPRPLVVLIGPEGDFTPDEIALARANAFLPVSLGSSRLRTETAAMVAAVLAGL